MMFFMNGAMQTTGKKPNRRIDKTEFHTTLTRFRVAGTKEDGEVLIDNLCYQTNGLIDYDKFWSELSGEDRITHDHRKLTPQIIKQWQDFAIEYPR